MASPDPPRPSASLLVLVGLKQPSAAGPFAERVAPALLERLAAAGVEQGLALATAGRCELYALTTAPAETMQRLTALVAEATGLSAQSLAPELDSRTGTEALRHLFAVAASLDSPVAGEAQALATLEAAHRSAAARGLVGGELEAILQGAYAAARRIRAETALAIQPISMAAAAVRAAIDLHGDLAACQALLVGAGDMGQLLADELARAGLKHLTVIHPNAARAALLARQHQCHYRPWDELEPALAQADILLSALGAGRETITAAAVRQALKQRRLRPMLLVDAAVPSDVETAVGDLEDAFRYDLEDLERIAMRGRSTRAAEMAAGQRILEAELAAFAKRSPEGEAAPGLRVLHSIFEAERRRALAAAGGDAELASRLLVERLLRRPTEELRALAAEVGPEAAEQSFSALVARLFGAADEADEGPRNGDAP